MNTLLQDLRYGFRLLLKSPGITTVAIVTLALGIGATTAIFTFVNAALIRALPFRDPQRLVSVSMTKGGEFGEMEASYPNYLDWKAQNTVFESVAGYTQDGGILYGTEPQLVSEGMVSGDFFSTLGVSAALGRLFSPADEHATQASLVVLSYAFWQKMGGKSDVLGRVLQLDNGDGRGNTVVIGVLPRDFEFAPIGDPQIFYLPPVKGDQITRRNLHWFNVMARLKPGVSLQQAHSNMDSISKHLAELYPQSNRDTGIKIVPLRDIIVGQVRPVLLLLFAAAGFVLLIACANIANVLLAKAAGRTREIAVRAALGARRSRIIRQFLTESVLLAGVAGTAGVVLAVWGVHALVQMVPPTVRQSMPFLNHLAVSRSALAFTAAVSLLTGILFGLAPALRPVPVSLHTELAEDSRGS